jgi:hypothetical protein
LFHYFEVSPFNFDVSFLRRYLEFFSQEEYNTYANSERDVQIMTAGLNALREYENFITFFSSKSENLFNQEIPQYQPQILIHLTEEGINITFEEQLKPSRF